MVSLIRRKHSVIGVYYRHFLSLMLIGSAFASVLLLTRYILSGSSWYAFLLWNLMLAWIPALITLWFTKEKRSAPRLITIILFIIWLAFLPNTFYVLSDFIHLSSRGDVSILFDTVMLFVFSSVGFLLGLSSLGIMHVWLHRRTNAKVSALIVWLIIFLCSFAIYLGRYLRWNSWDIIKSPFGLLVDVSDRIANPLDHPRTVSTTLLFFVMIGVSYASVWYSAKFIYYRLQQNTKL